MLHELCSKGKPQTACHVVSKSHQLKYWFQLLHLQHLWSVLAVSPPRRAQRYGRVHHRCREWPWTGPVLHHPQRQRWSHAKYTLEIKWHVDLKNTKSRFSSVQSEASDISTYEQRSFEGLQCDTQCLVVFLGMHHWIENLNVVQMRHHVSNMFFIWIFSFFLSPLFVCFETVIGNSQYFSPVPPSNLAHEPDSEVLSIQPSTYPSIHPSAAA